MLASILIGVLLVIGAGALFFRATVNPPNRDDYPSLSSYKRDVERSESARRISGVVSVIVLGAAVVLAGATSVFSQSVGQASVLVNAGGTIAGQTSKPGFQLKAPWQSRVVFDLFSQEVNYAGSGGDAPKYVRGEVSGNEVTAAVKGGAQANFDLSVVYTLSGDNVSDLYHTYRSQERLVQQVVEPQILSTIRKIPATYSPVEFRGEFRGEAQERMLSDLNQNLKPYGITVSVVSLQNITYTAEVEESIKNVEVANQELAKEEANLRAAEVAAQKRVVEAEATAEANRIEADSITENLIRQRWVDAIRESDATIVVPDTAAPLIEVPTK